jgi:hypothetical protein
MKHLLLTTQQYNAVMKSHLLHGSIDYCRYNDPDFGYGGSADFWVIYFKEPITPTWAFDLAWYSHNLVK